MKKPPKPKMRAIHMLLEEELLKRINAFRFKHMFDTRVEAFKALLEKGLSTDDTTPKKKDPKPPAH